jgi:hypothetical protein
MIYEATRDFHILTGKGVIKIRAGQTVNIPEGKARTLEGKIRKVDIKWDTLSAIHLTTARSIAAEGVNFRLSTPAITQAEDALNNTWRLCLKGQATLDDFKSINQIWADAVKAANEKAKKVRLF